MNIFKLLKTILIKTTIIKKSSVTCKHTNTKFVKYTSLDNASIRVCQDCGLRIKTDGFVEFNIKPNKR